MRILNTNNLPTSHRKAELASHRDPTGAFLRAGLAAQVVHLDASGR